MPKHSDMLEGLDRDIPLGRKLEHIHRVLKKRFARVHRIAVAIHDSETDKLSTFIHSSDSANPLPHYQASLSEAADLRQILEDGTPRVVNDLDIFAASEREHAQRIREQGYRSSYTMPMYLNSGFFGFVFFNSFDLEAFDEDILAHLDTFGHLISLVTIQEISTMKTLLAALKTAKEITHHRDVETGAHLDRMSRYAELIARDVADGQNLDDEYIEHVLMFAPLHDIGKIGIPDRILLKRDKLTDEEMAVMRSHAQRGRAIIDELLDNFDLHGFHHVHMLRNIAQFHHEAMNGAGYPSGLEGEEIPLEARIVAVADVFDALTSRRPYKEAWPNDRAFGALRKLAGFTLDATCVEALERRRREVEQIQDRFKENPCG